MKNKLLSYLFAICFIIILTFLLPRLLPGDPLQAIYGEEVLMFMSEEAKQELISRMALDQPLYAQFGVYILSLIQGKLGYSYALNAPVWEIIGSALPWTLLLVGISLLLSTVLGIILGIEAGWRRGKPADRFILLGSIMSSGMPNFLIGVILLLIFSVQLGWLPLGGAATPFSNYTGWAQFTDVFRHALLPILALTLANIGEIILLTRSSMVGNTSSSYIFTAAAKGVRKRVIQYKHAGRNSLLPVTARVGVSFGRLMAGSLFVEIVFAYPGMGTLIHDALTARDYPLLQGLFLVIALIVIVGNLAADWLIIKLDPRVQKSG